MTADAHQRMTDRVRASLAMRPPAPPAPAPMNRDHWNR